MTSESPIILIRGQKKTAGTEKVTARNIEQWKKGIEQRGDMREQGLGLRLRVQSSLQRSDFHL
jgi:hypothetical protein